MNASTTRLGIFAALMLLMAATRINHFAVVPDASWAVFFAAGYYLRGQWRWAFPALMALAVAVDYWVISATGMDFWAHYCVSPGYWFLLPAYFSLWAGGAWLAGRNASGAGGALQLGVALVASVALCHAFAQGGFYWLSDVVAEPSVSGWVANYGHWLLPYLQTAALYVGAIAVVDRLLRMLGAPAETVAVR